MVANKGVDLSFLTLMCGHFISAPDVTVVETKLNATRKMPSTERTDKR